jgi:hypothetical protein
MFADLFRRRAEAPYPAFLIDLVVDMFAIVQYWEPPAVPACERGRLFEQLFYRYCEKRRIHLNEQAGSRTLNGQHAASGFMHENDAVITTPDVAVHLELKHLSGELAKNELLIFNQKGLDYLFADNHVLRRQPLYRVVLSAGLLSPAARRFALQWGIAVIEPDRLPLLLLHFLAAHHLAGLDQVDVQAQEEIWREVPRLIVPVQERIQQLSKATNGAGEIVSSARIDRALQRLQREIGDAYWTAMDIQNPQWLEERYETLNRDLNLDGFQERV